MNGIYSNRDIETACRNDIRFMWILQDAPALAHSTISRFQNERLAVVMENLFYQLIEKLSELGELEFKNLFMDGTKIEANANRYTFVWAKVVQKKLNKLYARVDKELPEIALKYDLNPNVELQKAIDFLNGIACMSGIVFVSGRGRHKTELQRNCERLNEYRERIEKYQENLGICGKRKSYSKTNTDVTFMCLKANTL